MSAKPRSLISKFIIGLISLVLVVFLIYKIIYFIYYNYNEGISFHPTNDVIIIKDLFSEMFLIRTDKGFIAIDTGCNEDIIKRGFDYCNIKPEEVKAVFITHSDIDHQNAAELFDKAQFYFPKKEIEMIENKIPRFRYLPFIKNSVLLKKYIHFSLL